MRKIKRWFIDHFLPMWAKETVLVENRRLSVALERLIQQLEQKDAYIRGLEAGIRAQRRIIINTNGGITGGQKQDTDR